MSKKEKDCYVYKHIRKDTGQLFYIGIGSTALFKRAYWKYDRSKYWNNIVKLAGYDVEIVAENLSWEEACRKEIELIKLYGRKDLNSGILANLTNGGEGNLGYSPSKEQREKASERMKGPNHYFYGKHHSKEHRENISKSLIGKLEGVNNPFFGKKHSDESKLKISKIHKGKKLTNEQIGFISERMTKEKHPRAKIVLDTETGIFYECAKDAAVAKCVNYFTLNGFLNGKYKNKTSLIYV